MVIILIYKIKKNNYNYVYLKYFYKFIYQEKKYKIKKYKKKMRKIQAITGEILLKNLLKKHYKIDYKDLTFYLNKYNKPYIKNKNIYFNISHSYNYVAVAISNKEIGTDIEKIRPTNINTINYFATDNEIKYILEDKTKITRRLFTIYTLKEAYFKMKGTNLDNIKDIEFNFKDNKIICSDSNIKIKLINNKKYIMAIIEKKL